MRESTVIINTFVEKKNVSISHFSPHKWFNKECKDAKRAVNNNSKKRISHPPPHSGVYHTLEREYNKVKQKFERQYGDTVRLKLQNFHSIRPDAFCKMWKSLNPRQVNNSNLTLNQHEAIAKNKKTSHPPTFTLF